MVHSEREFERVCHARIALFKKLIAGLFGALAAVSVGKILVLALYAMP